MVDTDTRNIRKNTLFFALKGDNFNGNKFAVKALELGANYAIVDEKPEIHNTKIILVKNVLKTLQNLANYHRKQLNIKIIGLTGSNGKTTTKELIKVVLSKKYNTEATKGNLNNHIGVPLTLLSFTPKTQIGIVEMGANHQKEIEFLASICEPDFGYITNFGKAHLEGFGGVEGVIKGKSELYDYLKENNKKVFVNPEDNIQLNKTKEIERVLFDDLEFLDATPFVKIKFKNTLLKSNLIGHYNYSNIAAAVTIGNFFNVDLEDIKFAIESYSPKNNRSQIIKTKYNEIILDAYNANPSSVEVALENFSKIKHPNKIVFLGDMFELGEESLREHQRIVNLAIKLNLENIILVGNHFYDTQTSFIKFKSFNELKLFINKQPILNNLILIKGSRGMKLERLLDFIK